VNFLRKDEKEKKYRHILLTGSSGKLGRVLLRSQYFPNIQAPLHLILDITEPESIDNYFAEHSIDAVIHCAALARPALCESNPVQAIRTNIIGTCNMVMGVIKKEQQLNKTIRFIYISTDGVYQGIKGNYNEQDATIPYNKYGWTKLGAECAVNSLQNICIVRSSFFDTRNITFESSPVDMYSSKVPIEYMPKALYILIESDYIGTVNIGGIRKSDFERYREFKQTLKPCKRKDVARSINFAIYHDASMDTALWRHILADESGKEEKG